MRLRSLADQIGIYYRYLLNRHQTHIPIVEDTTMERHQRTQSTEPSNPQLNIFNAIEAIESLHTQLVRIEALAVVACDLADRLQPPSGRERKRELIRMQLFVGQTALAAREAVAYGDRLMVSVKKY
jgi:hypothetical protein